MVRSIGIDSGDRAVHVVNLDPAAEHFRYPVAADIRDLVPLEDVMSELRLGPNGGLIYAMEYLVDNIDWLESELDDLGAAARSSTRVKICSIDGCERVAV